MPKSEHELLLAIARAAEGLVLGTDWNKGTQAIIHGYRAKLVKAVKAYQQHVARTQRTCTTCGRLKVDPMTLNSIPVDRKLCYRDECGDDPRCKPKGKRRG